MTTPLDPISRLQAILGDRYVAERELGRGGMATVYLAQDTKHDRRVAVKVLRSEIGALLGAERFLHEIKLTSRLSHPHILPLYDSGEHEQVLYYVMPYIDGESLRDRVRREKRMRIDDAIRIAREVADALAYAHQLNIVHRDIKPENILLSGGHALVADFGIARAISRAGGEKWETLTASGVAIGTPAYMSPEQTVGMQDLDARSDVYSLGCVLYEMLAGDPPFVGPDGELAVARRFTEPAPLVRATRETVPAAIEAAICKALERDPSDRYATALEFADALAAASATGVMPAATAPASRTPMMLVAVSIALVSAAAIIYVAAKRPAAGPSPLSSAAAPSTPAKSTPTPTLATAPAPAVPKPADQKPQPSAPVQKVTSSVPTPILARRESLSASARTTAQDARRRAADAGATPAELATGDATLDAAEALASAGRKSDAETRVGTAVSSWNNAERVAHARTQAAAQQQQQQQQQTKVLPVVPLSVTPPAPAPVAPVDPKPLIESAVADYARAIQTRDIGELRRAYPGITAGQQSGWEQFFQSTQSIKATLSVTSLEVSGNTAEGAVAGSYDYVDASSGRTEHRPVAFKVTVKRGESGNWKLSSVR